MIEIRNLQFQPLTFNLAGDRTLHLGPRERTSIPQKDISPEITLAEKRGLVGLSKPEEKQPSVSDETAETSEPKTTKRRK
ncbi:MAG: hypothetical protein AB7F23_00865 [Phycisphaerae bacterium]